MKIVVFGAAGWTGRAVLSRFAGRHEVLGFDRGPEAWAAQADLEGEWQGGGIVHGDISDFGTVHRATEGVEGIVHLAVYFSDEPCAYGVDDPKPFLINLKGLWNVLESARQRDIRHIVHIGSCETVHPQGRFFTSEVRRPGGGLYALTKRLQEEMCRSFHDAYGTRIIVLRPDYIVDSRLGLGRHREKLGPAGTPTRNGWVCRHDLAQACRLAVESDAIDFDIFHIVGTPEAERTCNVARSREVLGLVYQGDLDQYRER
jgi:nucleoside-diphosphate-sugar epimerase